MSAYKDRPTQCPYPRVLRSLRLLSIPAAALLGSTAQADAPAAPSRILATVADFRPAPARELPPYTDWRWTPEQKAEAGTFTRRAVVPHPDGDGNVLRLEIAPNFPWRGNPERIISLTNAHFPPESDAVALRLRVESGNFTVAIGGPTAYFGDSDVITAPQRIEAGGWQDLQCDLHERLCRNYRRAGFGRDATAIAYNRWAQEPPHLYILPGSSGVLLLESATLVASGRGNPFQQYDSSSPTLIASIPTSLENAFTVLAADSQVADFELSWRDPAACRYTPPRLETLPAPKDSDAKVLRATSQWAEEIRWAGVRTEPAAAGANAVMLSVRVASPVSEQQLTSDAGQPVDIGLLRGKAGTPFPWQRLGPSEEWRQGATVRGFDLNLSNRSLAQEPDLNLAIYQARRFAALDEWQTFIIPLDDFVCIAGFGDYRADLESRASPAAGGLAGVVWMLPWPRSGRAFDAALEVTDVRLVAIAADGETPRRSYPAPQPGRLQPVPGLSDYGGWKQIDPKHLTAAPYAQR